MVCEEILTRSPESTKMYVLVLLLTRAFWPPLVGVGWSSRQLSGCSRGSGGGATVFLKSRVWQRKNTQISTLSTTSLLLGVKRPGLRLAAPHTARKSKSQRECNEIKTTWEQHDRWHSQTWEQYHYYKDNKCTLICITSPLFFFLLNGQINLGSSFKQITSCCCPLHLIYRYLLELLMAYKTTPRSLQTAVRS